MSVQTRATLGWATVLPPDRSPCLCLVPDTRFSTLPLGRSFQNAFECVPSHSELTQALGPLRVTPRGMTCRHPNPLHSSPPPPRSPLTPRPCLLAVPPKPGRLLWFLRISCSLGLWGSPCTVLTALLRSLERSMCNRGWNDWRVDKLCLFPRPCGAHSLPPGAAFPRRVFMAVSEEPLRP